MGKKYILTFARCFSASQKTSAEQLRSPIFNALCECLCTKPHEVEYVRITMLSVFLTAVCEETETLLGFSNPL